MPEPGKRVVLSWSSGKDSAWTLHVLRQNPDIAVVGLLTTFNDSADRVAMHAVRRELVRHQAAAADLPLTEIPLPWPCSNAQYEAVMSQAIEQIRRQLSPTHVAFGDLFLQDIRDYRLQQMAGTGLEVLFPLWHQPTAALAREMIDAGLQAVLTCVDPKALDAGFCGRYFDIRLFKDLPASADACGENGEFHSFVFDAPCFNQPIDITVGETVWRDGFVFTDVLPVGEAAVRAGRVSK